ncbi:MAG: hypothetical protein ACI8PZ_003269 [Myxococcota bacterium]|jgi:hypothetical protein
MSDTPESTEALARLEARVARMEATLDRLVDLLSTSASAAAAAGPDASERQEALAETLAIATEPEVMRSLGQMASQAPRLLAAVDLAAGVEEYAAAAFTLADDAAVGVGEVSLDARVQALTELLVEVSRPEHLAVFRGLLAHTERLGDALSVIGSEPRPLGPLALYRAMRETEVQRALGLVVAVARRLGAYR